MSLNSKKESVQESTSNSPLPNPKEIIAKNNNISMDIMKILYHWYRENLIGELEAMQCDLTELYYAYLEDKVKASEHINVAIRGEVSSGKSTVAITSAWHTNIVIKKLLRKENDMYSSILSDQIEYNRFASQDPDNRTENVAVVIDEYSAMGEGGLNATTESQKYRELSNMFAQYFIHRFSCSPVTVADENATLFLDVIGKDAKNKVTRCKVSYRNLTENHTLCLGYIDIDVGDTIEQEFYRKYRVKKFKRLELLSKHGIRDVRECEFSIITLGIWKELKEIASENRITLDVVRSIADITRRDLGYVYSILTLTDVVTKASSLLTVWSELNKKSREIEKIKNKGMKVPDHHIEYKKKLTSVLNRLLDEHRNLKEVYKIYLSISKEVRNE